MEGRCPKKTRGNLLSLLLTNSLSLVPVLLLSEPPDERGAVLAGGDGPGAVGAELTARIAALWVMAGIAISPVPTYQTVAVPLSLAAATRNLGLSTSLAAAAIMIEPF
jgi:hypothetical protein